MAKNKKNPKEKNNVAKIKNKKLLPIVLGTAIAFLGGGGTALGIILSRKNAQKNDGLYVDNIPKFILNILELDYDETRKHHLKVDKGKLDKLGYGIEFNKPKEEDISSLNNYKKNLQGKEFKKIIDNDKNGNYLFHNELTRLKEGDIIFVKFFKKEKDLQQQHKNIYKYKVSFEELLAKTKKALKDLKPPTKIKPNHDESTHQTGSQKYDGALKKFNQAIEIGEKQKEVPKVKEQNTIAEEEIKNMKQGNSDQKIENELVEEKNRIEDSLKNCTIEKQSPIKKDALKLEDLSIDPKDGFKYESIINDFIKKDGPLEVSVPISKGNFKIVVNAQVKIKGIDLSILKGELAQLKVPKKVEPVNHPDVDTKGSSDYDVAKKAFDQALDKGNKAAISQDVQSHIEAAKIAITQMEQANTYQSVSNSLVIEKARLEELATLSVTASEALLAADSLNESDIVNLDPNQDLFTYTFAHEEVTQDTDNLQVTVTISQENQNIEASINVAVSGVSEAKQFQDNQTTLKNKEAPKKVEPVNHPDVDTKGSRDYDVAKQAFDQALDKGNKAAISQDVQSHIEVAETAITQMEQANTYQSVSNSLVIEKARLEELATLSATSSEALLAADSLNESDIVNLDPNQDLFTYTFAHEEVTQDTDNLQVTVTISQSNQKIVAIITVDVSGINEKSLIEKMEESFTKDQLPSAISHQDIINRINQFNQNSQTNYTVEEDSFEYNDWAGTIKFIVNSSNQEELEIIIDQFKYHDDQTIVPKSAYLNKVIPGGFIIPNSVTKIEEFAFQGATLPEGFTLSKANIDNIEQLAFSMIAKLPDGFALPNKLEKMSFRLFWRTNIGKGFIIPASVTEIGEKAFQRSTLPENFTLANTNIKTIGKFAFSGFIDAVRDEEGILQEVVIEKLQLPQGFALPEGLEKIENGLFWFAILPRGFEIPNSVTEIGVDAFRMATLPEGFTLANTNVKVIGKLAFAGDARVVDEDATTKEYIEHSNQIPKNFSLPTTLKKIEESLFFLTEIGEGFTIPDSVTEIGSYAFRESVLPNNFIIPDSVSIINWGVFRNARLSEGFNMPNNPDLQKIASSDDTIPSIFWKSTWDDDLTWINIDIIPQEISTKSVSQEGGNYNQITFGWKLVSKDWIANYLSKFNPATKVIGSNDNNVQDQDDDFSHTQQQFNEEQQRYYYVTQHREANTQDPNGLVNTNANDIFLLKNIEATSETIYYALEIQQIVKALGEKYTFSNLQDFVDDSNSQATSIGVFYAVLSNDLQTVDDIEGLRNANGSLANLTLRWVQNNNGTWNLMLDLVNEDAQGENDDVIFTVDVLEVDADQHFKTQMDKSFTKDQLPSAISHQDIINRINQFNQNSQTNYTVEEDSFEYNDWAGTIKFIVNSSNQEELEIIIDQFKYHDDQTIVPKSAYLNKVIPGGFIIPNSVTKIEEFAFQGATLPEGFTLSKANIDNIEQLAFSMIAKLPDGFALPNKLEKMSFRLFWRTNIDKGFIIPASVTEIGEKAFQRSTLPENFTLANTNIKTIGKFAFSGFIDAVRDEEGILQEVVIEKLQLPQGFALPEGLEKIENGLFWSTILPRGFEIPNSVTEIGVDAFRMATLPEGFTLANTNVKVIGKLAFAGDARVVDEDATTKEYIEHSNQIPKNFSLPTTLKKIEESLFFLTEIGEGFTIPDSVTEIGSYAFKDTILPNNFIIPDSVSIINWGVFRNARLSEGFNMPNNPDLQKIASSDDTIPSIFWKSTWDNDLTWINIDIIPQEISTKSVSQEGGNYNQITFGWKLVSKDWIANYLSKFNPATKVIGSNDNNVQDQDDDFSHTQQQFNEEQQRYYYVTQHREANTQDPNGLVNTNANDIFLLKNIEATSETIYYALEIQQIVKALGEKYTFSNLQDFVDDSNSQATSIGVFYAVLSNDLQTVDDIEGLRNANGSLANLTLRWVQNNNGTWNLMLDLVNEDAQGENDDVIFTVDVLEVDADQHFKTQMDKSFTKDQLPSAISHQDIINRINQFNQNSKTNYTVEEDSFEYNDWAGTIKFIVTSSNQEELEIIIDQFKYHDDQTIVPKSAYLNKVIPGGFIIPNSVTKIEEFAFQGATLPEGFTLGKANIDNIEQLAFSMIAKLPDGFALPNKLEKMSFRLFWRTNIGKGFIIPASVTEIGEKAFQRSTLPENFTLANTNIKTIGKFAFSGFIDAVRDEEGILQEVVIEKLQLPQGFALPEGLEKIENGLFWSTILPRGFEIPNSVTEIGEYAFKMATLPEGFTLANTNVKVIGKYAFAGDFRVVDEGATTKKYMGHRNPIPKNFSLPTTLKKIEENLFYLTEIGEGFVIPNSVIEIGHHAFSESVLPNHFIIPDSVAVINWLAFYNAKLSQGFTMPNNPDLQKIASSDDTIPSIFLKSTWNDDLTWINIDIIPQEISTKSISKEGGNYNQITFGWRIVSKDWVTNFINEVNQVKKDIREKFIFPDEVKAFEVLSHVEIAKTYNFNQLKSRYSQIMNEIQKSNDPKFMQQKMNELQDIISKANNHNLEQRKYNREAVLTSLSQNKDRDKIYIFAEWQRPSGASNGVFQFTNISIKAKEGYEYLIKDNIKIQWPSGYMSKYQGSVVATWDLDSYILRNIRVSFYSGTREEENKNFNVLFKLQETLNSGYYFGGVAKATGISSIRSVLKVDSNWYPKYKN